LGNTEAIFFMDQMPLPTHNQPCQTVMANVVVSHQNANQHGQT